MAVARLPEGLQVFKGDVLARLQRNEVVSIVQEAFHGHFRFDSFAPRVAARMQRGGRGTAPGGEWHQGAATGWRLEHRLQSLEEVYCPEGICLRLVPLTFARFNTRYF